MRTLTFLLLVMAGLATVYALRERGPMWRSRPAAVMLLATVADLLIVISLALGGVLMAPLAPTVVAALLAATLLFAVSFDGVKRVVFARLRVD
jgi:H+-transporting ATPase